MKACVETTQMSAPNNLGLNISSLLRIDGRRCVSFSRTDGGPNHTTRPRLLAVNAYHRLDFGTTLYGYCHSVGH